MKKILSAVLCFMSLSSFAVDGIAVKPSRLSSYQQTGDLRDQLKAVTGCEQGYYLTRQRISNSYLEEDAGTVILSGGVVVGTFVALAFASPAGLLVVPPMALYAGARSLTQKSYTKSEVVFKASRFCGVECNYRPLNAIRESLSEEGIEVSNYDIAKVVNEGAQDLSLCTTKVKKNGVRKMKKFKDLKKSIAGKLRA